MSERMRAAVIAGAGRLDLVDRPLPAPGAGQIRIRVDGSGVCASNLPVWEGRPWFQYPAEPGAPGHEGWGLVDAIGPGVTGLAEGTRVSFLSTHAYATHDLTDAESVVRIPPALDGRACPGEPFACAVNVIERSGIRAGDVVAVVGTGFLGAVIVRLAAARGARVIALSSRPYARDLARDLGAEATAPMQSSDAVSLVGELTGGVMADCVVEACGVQSALDLSTALTRTRGRLVIAGYHQDGTRQVDLQTWNWRGLDVINAHERDPQVYAAGMQRAFDLAADGTLDFDRFLTHTLTIEQLDQAFELMTRRPEGFLKAVVTT